MILFAAILYFASPLALAAYVLWLLDPLSPEPFSRILWAATRWPLALLARLVFGP